PAHRGRAFAPRDGARRPRRPSRTTASPPVPQGKPVGMVIALQSPVATKGGGRASRPMPARLTTASGTGLSRLEGSGSGRFFLARVLRGRHTPMHDGSGPLSPRSRIVLAGHGMVGQKFLECLAESGADVDVTVLCEEPRAAYDRVHLTDFFSG